MAKALVFGGTNEGRRLCEFCASNRIPITYCVATEDGARPVKELAGIHVRVGRLSCEEMTELMEKDRPGLVLDASHPYAREVSINIKQACQNTGCEYVRVKRAEALTGREAEGEVGEEADLLYFEDFEEMVDWLEGQEGNIFVASGAKGAANFAKLKDFESRVWMRVLPNLDSLTTCLDLGYNPAQIICMQGPFTEELNRAMFKAAAAEILVTKDSGRPGGFSDKIKAARSLGMKLAILKRPEEEGITLDEAWHRLKELSQ